VRYRPAQLNEIENRPSLIGEPVPPDNVITLRKSRSLHAVLVENLNATRALRRHLEDGVTVSNDAQCKIIKSLFVATRDQVNALAAVLELEGLE